jgi:integrase
MANWTEAAVMRELRQGKHALGGNLYLRVQGASKIYIFRYQKHGKSSEKSLGPVHKLRLAEARATAAQYSADVFHGRSIGLGKKSGMTFETVAREALPQLTSPLCATGVREWTTSLLKVAAPYFGKTPINEITSKQVSDLLAKFWISNPEKADRLKARLSRAFAWSIEAGYRDTANPAHRDAIRALLGKVKRSTVHHLALEFERLPALFGKLMARSEPESIALQLCFHTGARSNEVLGATWEEFNLGEGVWRIGASRMKSRREHVVTLSEPAVELLADRLKAAQAGPLFNLDPHSMLRLLRELTGDEKLTVHGTVRAGFQDWAAEHEVNDRIIEDAMSHLDANAVRRAYRRNARLEKRREAMEYWSGFLIGKKFISPDEALAAATRE